MIIIDNTYSTAEENLAFEAAYFESFTEETLRIWRNPNAVILGKHQNAYAEVNLSFCKENNIPILRRISGGGTVFHDLGNINFSFYRFVDKTNQIRYDDNLKIITHSLRRLGYDLLVNERHDIYAGEFKISGNAQHVSRGRALHHGTILYNSDMEMLRGSIKKKYGKITDKSVKSFRSKVKNLRDDLNLGTNEEFFEKLYNSISEFGNKRSVSIEIKNHLKQYQTDTWNLKYGPKFQFESFEPDCPFTITVCRGGKIGMIESEHSEIKYICHDYPAEFDYDQINSYLKSIESKSAKRMIEILFS
jgi:lipoate-protein ligase A